MLLAGAGLLVSAGHARDTRGAKLRHGGTLRVNLPVTDIDDIDPSLAYGGVSWHIESARKDSLRFTGGVLWTQQRNTEDVETKFTALRVGISYRCPINANAYLVHAMEAIPNLDETEDWRFNSETSAIAAFSKKFSLKVSFTLHYDNLPEPTFKKTDRILTAGIQFAY